MHDLKQWGCCDARVCACTRRRGPRELASRLGGVRLLYPHRYEPNVWESLLPHGGRLERGTSSCTRREGVTANAWGEGTIELQSMREHAGGGTKYGTTE